MKTKLILLLLTVFTINNVSAQDTLRVLFLGNSYTSYNNLPQLVQSLSSSAGKTLIIDSNMPGGMTVSGHINDATSFSKISQGNWDYVIIQEQSQIPTIDFYRYNDMYPAMSDLKVLVEQFNPCTRIITYMTWGRRFGGMQCDPSNTYCSPNFADFNHMQDSLTSAYLEISELLDFQCAPAGVVWQNIINDTTLVLHSTDNSHPNLDGSYVAACAIFSSIWKQGASGLGYTAGLAAPLAQYYQSASDQTVFSSNAHDWNLYINSPVADFSESVSGNTVTFTDQSSSIHSPLTYFWDFGDGNTSNALSTLHTYATNGTYTVTLIVSSCIFSDTITKTIQIGTTSVQENRKSKIELFPNPAYDQVILKVDPQLIGMNYTLHDCTGKSLLQGTIRSDRHVIYLTDLPNGIYTLALDELLKERFKLIIQ
jgi:hypothetical protein